MRVAIWAAVLAFGLPSAHAQQSAPAAIPVGVVKAERAAITRFGSFAGRVKAINRAEVRARVTGHLEAELFKEGDMVREGAPLYRLDQGPFKAAVEQTEGILERSKRAGALTQVELRRAEDLLSKHQGTAVARDQALAADQQARAGIMAAEASLAAARLDLSLTNIVSPIEGRIGNSKVTTGNVIGPGSGVLTTIVSQDPMYVVFPVSEGEIMSARKAGRRPGVEDFKEFTVHLRLADGSPYDQVGSLNFVDLAIDRATGTVLARASVPNPKGILRDGERVDVELELAGPQEKMMVPQSALVADQEGICLLVVENGKAIVRRVELGEKSGTGVVIEHGLAGGEWVIVEPRQGVRPGAPVQARPVQRAFNGD